MTVGYEYPLYSDARLVGERLEGLGPYSFLNSIPLTTGTWIVNAPMILRTKIYVRNDVPDMSKTDEALYHGGETIADELAALASLSLGVRVHAGGASRHFGFSEDPLGQPREGWGAQKPSIQPRHRDPMLPSVTGEHSMNALSIMESIPSIDPHRYVSLVRACRAYQESLWIADTDANLAWVLLVSALETAAGDEISSAGTPEEILTAAKPQFTHNLKSLGDPEVLLIVAKELSPTLKSTKKFIDFALRFMPDPPQERPQEAHLQIDWTQGSMKKVLDKIYGYRSRFLHTALPFPAPMLTSFQFQKDLPPPEVPMMGLGSSSHGATWTRKDTPINLHCFHYIVRGVLLNWWKKSLDANNF